MLGDVEVARIAGSYPLTFPITSKSDLVAQMSLSSTITFRDIVYNARSAADLVPGFFFPLTSSDDFIAKSSELIASRGLADLPPEWTEPDATGASTEHIPPADGGWRVDDVVGRLESSLAMPVSDGRLPRDRVDAIDVVSHALDFVDHPRGLELWREALWGRRLAPDARSAVEAMTVHVRAAAERGEWTTISEICDCLEELLEPSVAARRHVGGVPKGGAPAR